MKKPQKLVSNFWGSVHSAGFFSSARRRRRLDIGAGTTI